tara:strand:+ start:4495 stop:4731 length:237 start_codon:yes stop_codon:yes gene_type:complete
MKKLTVSEVSEAIELLTAAQTFQNQVDLITAKITRLMGGVKDDLIHELVDQAVLNKESVEWIIEEVQSWEKYRQELKL